MKRLVAAIGSALGIAALYRLLRRRESAAAVAPAPAPDARAEELRQKLAEARAVVDERDEFEGAETTIDEAEAAQQDPAERRRRVHEEARGVVDRMRGSTAE